MNIMEEVTKSNEENGFCVPACTVKQYKLCSMRISMQMERKPNVYCTVYTQYPSERLDGGHKCTYVPKGFTTSMDSTANCYM